MAIVTVGSRDRRVLRGKFVAGLRGAIRQRKLSFRGTCLPLSDEKGHILAPTLSSGPGGPRQAGPRHVLLYMAHD
jgi:hypothetical protein